MLKREYKYFVCLLFSFAACLPLHAQTFNVKTYSAADGMPGSSIQNIFADSYGYLWVSTDADLLRFDGTTFTRFGMAEGLLSALNMMMFEDSNHVLWGSENESSHAAVLCFNEGKFTLLPFEKNEQVNYIFSFYELPGSAIGVCTNNGVFERVNNHWQKINPGIDERKMTVRKIIPCKDHSLLICTDLGIFKKSISGKIETIADTSFAKWFNTVIPLGENFLVVGFNRLFIYDNKKMVPVSGDIFKDDYIICAAADHLGRIYACGTETGIYVFDHAIVKQLNTKEKIPYGFVKSICEDREGNIWTGALKLYRLRKSYIDQFNQQDGLVSDDNRSVLLTKSGSLYFGEMGFTIWNHQKFIPSTQLLRPAESAKFSERYVYSFEEDQQQRIWMLLHTTVLARYKDHVLEDLTNRFNPARESIGQIRFDPADSSILIPLDSIIRIKNDRIIEKIPLVVNNNPAKASALCFDHQQRLWIGTTGDNIGYVDLKTKKFYVDENFSEGRQCRKIICAGDGTVWAATTNDGILHYRVDKQGKIVLLNTITEGQNLLSNSVSDLCFDHRGLLWVSTADGIIRYQLVSRYNKDSIITYQIFGADDGLSPESFAGNQLAVDHNNNVWVTTENGVYRIRQQDIFLDSTTPRVQIEKLEVPNDSTNGKRYAKYLSQYFHLPVNPLLPYNRNTVIIYFNSIAYAKQSEVECEYKLEGLNNKWINSISKSNASFVNLAAGSYVFHVRAKRKNFGWSKEETFAFTIKTPFWQTWWFMLLCIASILAFLHFMYRIRHKRLLAVERTRTRIARDLHDDIGSTLTSITYFSEAAKMQLNQKEEKGGDLLLDKIIESSRSTISSMNDVVWAISPKNDQLEDLIVRMKHYAAETFGHRNILFHFFVKGNENSITLTMETRKNYLLVFKECVHNIIKYANCKTVNIYIEQEHQNLTLIVKDDGAGFEKGEITGEGNGLQNMHQRANEIKGQLVIESATGKGTSISLTSKIT